MHHHGLRLVARLVDAESGAQLWSETYTRDVQPDTVIAVQDDVTDCVVATVADVHGVLLRAMSVGVTGRPLEELDSQELRLRYWAYHRQHAPDEHMLAPIAREGLGLMAGLFWDLGESGKPAMR